MTVTVMVTVAVPSAVTLSLVFTETVEARALTGPETKVTVGCWAIVVAPTLAVTVLVPELVEVSVAVVWPLASVTAGVETVLPVPLTDKVTVWPMTGL